VSAGIEKGFKKLFFSKPTDDYFLFGKVGFQAISIET